MNAHNRRQGVDNCILCGVSLGIHHKSRMHCQQCLSVRDKRNASAGMAVKKAIKSGVLPSIEEVKCHDCGGEAEFYDHADYSKPLEVEAVCRSCNTLRGPANTNYWNRAEFDTKHIYEITGYFRSLKSNSREVTNE